MAEPLSALGTCSQPDCRAELDMKVIVRDQEHIDLDETNCPIATCNGTIVWEEGERL